MILYYMNIFRHKLSLFRVHLKIGERLTVVAGRDGGLQTMEILGMVTLRISDGEFGQITIALDHKEERGIQFQVR